MIVELGHYALIAALAASLVQSLVPLIGAHRGDERMMAVGDTAAVKRVAKIGVSLAEKILAHDQDNWVAVSYGAVALAALGESGRAKEWMNRALLIEPNRIEMRFNFACALASNLQEKEAAIDMLEPVLATANLGFLRHIKVDADLDSLRDDPRYQALVAAAEARTAADEPDPAKGA